MKKPEDVRRFLREQLEVAEIFMASGDFERGLNHFSIALAVSGRPDDLLVRPFCQYFKCQ
jgi:hypothetical protein